LQYGQIKEPTKFVTLNFKLDKAFNQENISTQLKEIESFYNDIDYCDNPKHSGWRKDNTFQNLFRKEDDSINVSIVSKEQLENSLAEKENWDTNFISPNMFEKLDKYLIHLYPNTIDAFRGERTNWNEMFVIPSMEVRASEIEDKFLIPYVKSPTELNTLGFDGKYENYLFVCDLPIAKLKANYTGAYKWIQKFKNKKNTNGTRTIQETCEGHKPFWYSLRPKKANIVTAINPFERFFFSFSENAFTIDQRLIAINVKSKNDVELIAALLNSIVTFLTVEMRGTSRNLGVLDLNANYFKTLRVLNPEMLTFQDKKQILNAFRILKKREIGTVFEEIKKTDRINFDKTVLKAFGISETILSSFYQILSSAVYNRVTMKER